MSNEGMVNNVMEREFMVSWRWVGGGRTATNGNGEGRTGWAEDGRGGRCRRSKWQAE